MVKRLVALSAGACLVIALVGAGTASATALCKTDPASHVCPAEDVYNTGDILNYQLASGTKLVLKSGPAVVECSAGSWNSSITGAGGVGASVIAANTAFSLGTCNHSIKTLKPGQMSIDWVPGTHNGTLTIKYIELELTIGSVKCKYGGTIPLELAGGSSSIIGGSVHIERISGALCSNPAKLTMQFAGLSQPVYVTES